MYIGKPHRELGDSEAISSAHDITLFVSEYSVLWPFPPVWALWFLAALYGGPQVLCAGSSTALYCQKRLCALDTGRQCMGCEPTWLARYQYREV